TKHSQKGEQTRKAGQHAIARSGGFCSSDHDPIPPLVLGSVPKGLRGPASGKGIHKESSAVLIRCDKPDFSGPSSTRELSSHQFSRGIASGSETYSSCCSRQPDQSWVHPPARGG